MASKPTRRRSMMTTITSIFSHHSSGHGAAATLERRHSTAESVAGAKGTPASTGTGVDTTGSPLERAKSATNERRAERESDLSQTSQDLLFRYQLEQADPRRLGPEAFHFAGVAANHMVSARIYAVLQRHNIISSHAGDYKVYTERINRQLPSQLPRMEPADLHRMVGMLFFWEQEQVRWNLIESEIRDQKTKFERKDAEQLLSPPPPATDGDVDQETSSGFQQMSSSYERQARLEQHKLTLAHLENSKRLLPSLREVLSRDDAIDHSMKPPAYGDSHNSVPVMGSPSREDVSIFGAEGTCRTGVNRDTSNLDAVANSSNSTSVNPSNGKADQS